jgi:flavin-binding protein dodecin
VAQGIIALLRQPEHGDPVVLERHREAIIVGRKVRGQKNKVHRGLPREKLTKYTKFSLIYDLRFWVDICIIIISNGQRESWMKIVVLPWKLLYSDSSLTQKRREKMADSVYKVITLIGTSTESWERAAATAVERAAQTLEDLRVAEVKELDMLLEEGKVVSYRAKVKVSFKYREEVKEE